MTKKYFIRMADYLTTEEVSKYCRIASVDGETYVLLTDLHKHLADFNHEMNPRFDRHRWLSYIAGRCGPNGGVINH